MDSGLNKIAKMLREMRKNKGLTQQELANNINYSIRQIKRSESENSVISGDFINALSEYYNIDMEKNLYIITKFGSVDSYNKYKELRKFIEDRDIEKIKIGVNKVKTIEDFTNGMCRKLIYYCDALLYAMENVDYNKSNRSCFDGLNVSNITECIELIRTGTLDEMDYPLLFQVAHNCKFDCNIELFHKIINELYSSLERVFQVEKFLVISADYYMIKYYIFSIYDMSYSEYKLARYEESLMYLLRAIDKTHVFRNYTLTPFLYELKFRIHYKLGNINKSKNSFELYDKSCTLLGLSDYFESNVQKIREKYSKLFE